MAIGLTASLPLASKFITGGGYMAMQNSAGLYPGSPGTNNNVGFNVQYDHAGTRLHTRYHLAVPGAFTGKVNLERYRLDLGRWKSDCSSTTA